MLTVAAFLGMIAAGSLGGWLLLDYIASLGSRK
jgi:hypothetical protein